MTGPEHYREGERLLTLARRRPDAAGPLSARAAAHFSAALAAAAWEAHADAGGAVTFGLEEVTEPPPPHLSAVTGEGWPYDNASSR